MAHPKLPGLHAVTVKGKTYFYAWRGGPRMRTSPTDAVRFTIEYGDHQAAHRGGHDGSTLAGLVESFKASSEWIVGIGERTKKDWSPWLDKIKDHFGALRIRTFDRAEIRADIKKWRDKWAKTPRTADVALEVLSRLLSFGVSEGKLHVNPVFGIARLYDNDRSEIIWTDDDLEKLKAKASPEVYAVAKMGALTGFRRADLLAMNWSDVEPLCIEIRTRKSRRKNAARGKNRARVPMYADLRTLLDTLPKRGVQVLTNTRKRPWASGFSASWTKAMHDAGLKGLHFHDLRGTACTKLFLAGFAIREIAQVMGWREGRVEALIDRYVNRDAILTAQIARLDAASRADFGTESGRGR